MDKRIHVTVCCGTACYVLGGSDFLELGKRLPQGLRSRVDIDGETCLGRCKEGAKGSRPCARIDSEIIEGASVETLVEAIAARAEALDQGVLV
jgi:NADH:ubiquinone oxidoreductase subunit E